MHWIPTSCHGCTAIPCRKKQHVVVGGASSPDSPVLSGVPQGSVLGPLLFLIYIDDVSSLQLSGNSVLNLYADDMLLYKQIKCSEDYQQLQMDIDKISSWVDHNKLSLNPANVRPCCSQESGISVILHSSY